MTPCTNLFYLSPIIHTAAHCFLITKIHTDLFHSVSDPLLTISTKCVTVRYLSLKKCKKKCKVDVICRVFDKSWTAKYFLLRLASKPYAWFATEKQNLWEDEKVTAAKALIAQLKISKNKTHATKM